MIIDKLSLTSKRKFTPVKERHYQLVRLPSISPKGRQRQIVLDVLASAKQPLTVAEIAKCAASKGLKAVGGVEPSCRYHLHYLVNVGLVKVTDSTTRGRPPKDCGHIQEITASADIERMARGCYGYGRWDAPYWFIGLGEGIGTGQNPYQRAEIWRQLQCEGLCDCRSFHRHKLIDDKRWHVDRVSLQPTWRPLMLILKAFLGEDAEQESLRKYQRDRWGMRNGDTCVIELFGLPAPTLEAYKALMHKLFPEEEIGKILQARIDFLRGTIMEKTPKLIVMYGYTAEEQWKKIVRVPMVKDKPFKVESTIVIWTKHPMYPNPEGDAYWKRLGNNCAEFANR